jgi:hypothetical protein
MAITLLQLAEYRGVEHTQDGGITGGAFMRVGLPMIGGCQRCGATIAAYNASPSKTGYLMCSGGEDEGGCIDDLGFDTVEEANMFLFPKEYQWLGSNNQALPSAPRCEHDQSCSADRSEWLQARARLPSECELDR